MNSFFFVAKKKRRIFQKQNVKTIWKVGRNSDFVQEIPLPPDLFFFSNAITFSINLVSVNI